MAAAPGPSAFEKRERADEAIYFRQEERLAMLKRLEKMVEQGKLNKNVLEEVKKATSPDVHHVQSVEVSPGVFKDVPGEVTHKTDYVYAHNPGQAPPPRLSEAERMKTGMHVDLGPSKWNPGGEGSVFSLSQSLAEEAPRQNLPPHEAARLARLQKAAGAVEMPTLFGYKLAPGLTPGRAFFWGGVLAVWGTAALVAASGDDLPVRKQYPGPMCCLHMPLLLLCCSAIGERLAAFFLPWRERYSLTPAERAERAEREHSEFVRKLKDRMIAGAGAAAAKS
ncbi:hypothetical protein ABPG75_000575 [Micractinium tetrahymenae]